MSKTAWWEKHEAEIAESIATKTTEKPKTHFASRACEFCQGTGFEIVECNGIEGAKRCRCGGKPQPFDLRSVPGSV